MTDTPTLTPSDLDELRSRIDAGELKLTSGHHDPTTGQGCAMDLIVWQATGEIADHADCVHRRISTYIHHLNDRGEATPESRWEIVEAAGPAILGTSALPSAHVGIVLMGVETGAQLAANLATLDSDGAPAVLAAHSATTGYAAHSATTGDDAHSATTGVRAHSATTGVRAHSATTGYAAIAASLGGGYARSAAGGVIVIAWHDGDRRRLTVGYVDEDGVKPDRWYRTDAAGELELVPDDECPPVMPLGAERLLPGNRGDES